MYDETNVNVYDFDNTIYNGDSTADFIIYSLKKHPKIFVTFPETFKAFIKFYVLKKGSKTQFKEVLYRLLKYCDTEKDVHEFWETHMKNIKKWYLDSKKENDVIISASPEFLLKIPCENLGIKYLMASRVDPHTGLYDGENCHGEEKVRRFYEKFSENIQVDNFFSDSYSDTPLAKISSKSYIVKGNKLLDWDFGKK